MDLSTLCDRAKGCLSGLALGDALGAKFEGGPVGTLLTTAYRWWRGEPLSYTDDTEMTLGVIEGLLEDAEINQETLVKTFAWNYTPGRGYGPGTAAWLRTVRRGASWRDARTQTFPNGSLGNGAAMRAAPIGLVHAWDPDAIRRVSDRQAETTHAHPLGMEGAAVVAYAAAMAFREPKPKCCGTALLEELKVFTTSEEYRVKFDGVISLLREEHDARRVAKVLGNGVEALSSAPTAIYLLARFSDDFDGAVEAVIELGGDTDTIAAMAGAMVGAHVGKTHLPAEALQKLEGRDRIEALGDRYAEVVAKRAVID